MQIDGSQLATLLSWRKEVGWLYEILKYALFLILYTISLLERNEGNLSDKKETCQTSYQDQQI